MVLTTQNKPPLPQLKRIFPFNTLRCSVHFVCVWTIRNYAVLQHDDGQRPAMWKYVKMSVQPVVSCSMYREEGEDLGHILLMVQYTNNPRMVPSASQLHVALPAACTIANSNNMGVTCQNGTYDVQGNALARFGCNTGYYFANNQSPDSDLCLPCTNISNSNNVALTCSTATVCTTKGNKDPNPVLVKQG